MTRFRILLAIAVLAAIVAAIPDMAFAQADPFTAGVQWFRAGPARGVAMFAVAAVAVMAWLFTASIRVVGFVVAGGLLLGNLDTIVGWMGL